MFGLLMDKEGKPLNGLTNVTFGLNEGVNDSTKNDSSSYPHFAVPNTNATSSSQNRKYPL